jgi:hypothetical protein
MMRSAAALVGLLLVAGVVAACVPQAVLPDDCNAAAVQRQAILSGDHMNPNRSTSARGSR